MRWPFISIVLITNSMPTVGSWNSLYVLSVNLWSKVLFPTPCQARITLISDHNKLE